MNSITLSGNLYSEVQMQDLPNGTSCAEFGIAVNKKVGDKKDVSFFRVKAYGFTAKQCGEMKKGDSVLVSGELKQERWEKDGKKMEKVVIVAFTVGMIKTQKNNVEETPF